jgi:hypothetical protein
MMIRNSEEKSSQRGIRGEKVTVLSEPLLEFRYGQQVQDPREGLSLFGPLDANTPGSPKDLSYGLIGTETGVKKFVDFSHYLRSPVIFDPSTKNPRLWPAFPGFDVAFDCKFPENATRTFLVDEGQLLAASKQSDPNQRAYAVVEHYVKGVEKLKSKTDERLDVVICVVPEEIWKNCRPKSLVKDATGEVTTSEQRKMRAGKQKELFREIDFVPYEYAVDFRRQLKARVMKYEIPIQIIRETTLRTNEEVKFGDRILTPPQDRAWNLGLALYYKAGGKPWRLSTAREGVCYIGLVYRRTDPIHEKRTACCAAQMFLDTGDGVVLRSDFGPWYSPSTKQLHLSYEAAQKLLRKVLSTYESLGGKRLKEVFLHYRSSIDRDEYQAFKSVCPQDVKIVAIRVASERFGVHLYREGTRPMIRGAFWKITDRLGYLWGSGFKARLGTYDGLETPVPLRIQIEYGEADIMQVATDILGLTKLNFNECKFGDSAPVTIGFSDAVGEILVSNPSISDPSPRFKHYI